MGGCIYFEASVDPLLCLPVPSLQEASGLDWIRSSYYVNTHLELSPGH